MSALTMKTSAHTDTYHALDRTGTRAVCRGNLKPATWAKQGGGVGTVVYPQSGDTFKRSCSRSRVNCLACRRKLTAELTNAEAEAHRENATRTEADPAPAPAPVHELESKIKGQRYRASGVDSVAVRDLAGGEMILAEVAGQVDFTRVIAVSPAIIPPNADWRGVRSNRPRNVVAVTVVGSADALLYWPSETVTLAH